VVLALLSWLNRNINFSAKIHFSFMYSILVYSRFPESHFPGKTFPEKTIPGNPFPGAVTFPEWMYVSGYDVSRKVTTFPNALFTLLWMGHVTSLIACWMDDGD